ncbi:telomerase Cajal body protein 1 homolog [Megalopta genalis]|uniref:telomerase Cajal body protein 1 homolog n=1 Tax=Megalopta genalis TaxID=115081 RepID=UPI003FD56151
METSQTTENLNETTDSTVPKSLTLEEISQEEISGVAMQDLKKSEGVGEMLENFKVKELQESSENTNSNTKEEESQHVNRVCYKWDIPLKQLREAVEEYQPTKSCENFTKGCQWSPDGTCLLVSSEDFNNRIYELPHEFYSEKIPLNVESTNMTAILNIKEGGIIYDTCWYPYMNSWEPATCCFLSTSRQSPIHLWDAFNGELRATYRAYNQVDEVEASISVQFIDSAKELWAGYKNALRFFDMERPGRQINTIYFKKEFPNVIGLVSCIRENPIMPGLVAFGTYSKCIGLYKNGPLCSFQTGSGVTQIEFSPCGTKLFSAVRRSNEFLCWDLRNPGTVLHSFQGRQANTNQRIHFNITPDAKQLISGGTDGNIVIWELSESINDANPNLTHQIKLSSDCINGVSLHNTLPILATSTGQRLCDSNKRERDNSVRLWSPTS